MTTLNKINISKNSESIIEDYHAPEFVSEVVTVRNNILNLTEVPSEDYSVEIEDFTEVTDFDLLASNTVDDLFYVNYKQGYITLNKEHSFEKITVNYYGIGKSYLSAFRVYVGTDSTGNVAETLGDLFKQGEDIVEALDVYGGYATMILRIDSTTTECNALLNRIDQRIAQIKSTDCQSTMITLTDWTVSSDGIYDYESSISHTLQSTNILCEFENTSGVSINDGSVKYKVVSNDKIKVYSNSRLPIKVKYMARYYNGLDSTNVTRIRQELDDSKMDSVNEIIYPTLNNRLNIMEEEIKNICFIMPEPLTVSENNEYINKYIKVAKLGYHVTIKFMKGTYKFNSIFMESNVELIGNDTVFEQQLNTIYNPETGSNINLTPFICLTKPFDTTSNGITKYNGNHNITIKGITFNSYIAFLMSHNKNITIEDCDFINTKSEHVFQIAASQNVNIKRCNFKGMVNTSSDRKYVEMIQINFMNNTSQPYWVSTANIYDHYPNDNIVIEDCTFNKGSGTYAYLKTGIGSNGADETGVKNKNITIKRCTFNNFEYAGITARYMDGITVEDCNFNINNSDGTSAQGIMCTNSSNINIVGRNSFNKLRNRTVYTSMCDKIRINGLNGNKLTCDSDFILIGESNDIIINDISINNSTAEKYGLLLRNVTDTIVNNINDNSNVISNGISVRLYNSDDKECSRITINNISTPNNPVSSTAAVTKICSPYIREALWEGEVTSKGIIRLSDSLSKFKDIRIKIGLAGYIEKPLTFPKGYSKCILRGSNIADDTTNISSISFFEININKNSETELEVLNINRVDLGATTISPVAEGTITIYGIYGERISY